MPHGAPSLAPDSFQDRCLEQWVAAGFTPQEVVLRCRIALMASNGDSVLHIAQVLEVQHPTVRLWRDLKGVFVSGGESQRVHPLAGH